MHIHWIMCIFIFWVLTRRHVKTKKSMNEMVKIGFNGEKKFYKHQRRIVSVEIRELYAFMRIPHDVFYCSYSSGKMTKKNLPKIFKAKIIFFVARELNWKWNNYLVLYFHIIAFHYIWYFLSSLHGLTLCVCLRTKFLRFSVSLCIFQDSKIKKFWKSGNLSI